MCQRVSFVLMLTLALGFATTDSVLAAVPVVQQLEPAGVRRGEEQTITLRGQRLGDAYKVLCDLPGIEVLAVEPVDDKTVTVRLTSDPTLAPGLYPLRLVTRSGIANLRLIAVGTMPVVNESEPNNDFESPQTIDLNTTIEGIVTNEDVDHYAVDLSQGQTLRVEIEGIRLHYTLNNQNILDPFVAILDDQRFEVAASDDSSLLQQDSFCSLTAPKDGRYTVLIRDSSFRGSGVCRYRAHIGTFPRPVVTIPGGGIPGTTVETKLISSDEQETPRSLTLPDTAVDRWPIITEDEHGISPSPNWVRVNDLPVVMEQEPNNDHRKAPTTTVPVAFCGVLNEPNDFDCIAFECAKGQRFRVQCYARGILRSPVDGVMHVFGPDHKTVAGANDVAGRLDPFIEFAAPADGQYTVRIYDHLRGGGPLHHYRIEVTPAAPEFSLSLKELRRDQADVVSVPIGGQTAMMVTAARRGYGGPIELKLDGLPTGVTAQTFQLPGGRPEVPVLLTAASDAQHDAALFSVMGSGVEPHTGVTGAFAQNHKLVLGQNRRMMWTYETERAAIAVTDSAPFTIKLAQPNTSIVRNGSKNLRVEIERNEGFEAPVTLRTLYNPPGIGVNNSRKIDKGQTAVDIPITANGGAGLGTWPMIMVASYPTALGQTSITTNPIMLEVEDTLFRYEPSKSAAQQGSEGSIVVQTEVLRDLPGDAELELVGLPPGVSSPQSKQAVAADAGTVTFPITIAADAKVGNHKTLVCIARVTVGDEVILQTSGVGELRVDPPPPKPKAASPEPAVAKEEKPAAPTKPLSRLEQLRQAKKAGA